MALDKTFLEVHTKADGQVELLQWTHQEIYQMVKEVLDKKDDKAFWQELDQVEGPLVKGESDQVDLAPVKDVWVLKHAVQGETFCTGCKEKSKKLHQKLMVMDKKPKKIGRSKKSKNYSYIQKNPGSSQWQLSKYPGLESLRNWIYGS